MLASLMHWLGYGLCHQLPERSFFAGGWQVPVCARDTGIYVGFLISFAMIAWLARGRRPADPPSGRTLALVAAFIGAMALDGVSSYAGWRTTTNEIRLATGLLAGYAMPVVLVPILNGQLWRRVGAERVLGRRGDLGLWLASLPVAFVVIRWPFELLGVVYPLIVSAAILFTFVAVNLAVVSLLPAAEGRAERLRQLWPWIAVAVVATVTEISVAGWVRFALTGLSAGR